MREHIAIIRDTLREQGYGAVALVAMAVFGFVNWWLITRTTQLSNFFTMAWNGDYFPNLPVPAARALGVGYSALYWLMTLATVALFGIAASLLVWLFRHTRASRLASAGQGVGGTVAALFAAGCPVCGTFLLSLLGVVGGLAVFPLKGLELKGLSLGLMAGSVVYAAKKIKAFQAAGCAACAEGVCETADAHGAAVHPPAARSAAAGVASPPLTSLFRGVVLLIAGLLLVNQLMIGSLIPKAAGASGRGGLFGSLFGAQGAAAQEIIAPQLNADGRTTSLIKQPTITEVPAEPKGGDPVEAAKAVMIPTGAPFYAPDGVSFDDPLNAQETWGGFERGIQLSADLERRYKGIVSTFTCNYCCGGPTSVTTINRCGCRHAKAWRGMARYLLQNYGTQYTDDQMKGEMYRWTGLWYPKGVIEDYLLATGRGDVIGHATHGGAGTDGRHGL